MTDSSSPRFIQPVKPVDALTRRVLRLVDDAAAGLGVRYFVAGATARDLMLANVFGLPPGRATRDIDFGLAVESWEQFETLKLRLTNTGQFDAAPKSAHRLLWNGPGASSATPIDVIPFGSVASEGKKVLWLPNRDTVLNVAGFEEALKSAVHLQMEHDLVVRVASITGLAVLKIVAWQDRRNESNKDATDLHRLLVDYADAGNLDRMYEEELPLLEAAGFDMELAGAQLLGRDAARICRAETRHQISAILASDLLVGELIREMNPAAFDEAQTERIFDLLNRFRKGFASGWQ